MKKLLAILLALIMVLVSAAALAADPEEPKEPKAGGDAGLDTSKWVSESFEWTVPIKKNYTVTGGDTYPAEVISFTPTSDTTNPDGGAAELIIADYTVSAASNTNVLKITVPSFSAVGLYHFTIAENTGSTQGVTYNTGNTTIKLSILVTYDYENSCLVVEETNKGITAVEGEDGKKVKTDELKNKYELGGLKVTKEVKGSLGKKDQPFTIKVTFNAATGKTVKSDIKYTIGSTTTTIAASDWSEGKVEATIQLKDSESAVFANIPVGVTYTVEEDATHKAADPSGADGATGYTVSGEVTTAKTIAVSTTPEEKITNTKDINIDTGVALDSAIYMLIMALAVAGFVVLKVRRREEY